MIEKINHYSMHGRTSVYDEEAMTALELASRTAGKVNELIDATDKKVTEQDEKIESFANEIQPRVDQAVEENINKGTFDKQIEKHIGDLEERVDNLLNNVPSGSTTMDAEVVDVRVGYDKKTHSSAGESVRHQMLSMARFMTFNGFNYDMKADELVKGELYSNSDGTISKGDTYYRSKYIYPCKEGAFFTFTPKTSASMNPYNYIACYDHNMRFIGFSRIASTNFGGSMPVNVTLAGTCFVGFSFNVDSTTATLEGVKIHHIENGLIDAIYEPFEKNNVNYAYYKNHWCGGGSATIGAVTNFDCVVFNVEGLKQIASTEGNLYNAIFIDINNMVVSKGETYTELSRGRLYDVPENAVICVMNLSTLSTRQGEKITNGVVSLIHKNGKGLNGKTVGCIGDSITWLDGQQGYDQTSPFEGWQDELRKRGAIVRTHAVSGAPYTFYLNDGDDNMIDSITGGDGLSHDIIDSDIVILFGGSNDIRLDAPIGEVPNQYESLPTGYYGQMTLVEAIAGIIGTCRDYGNEGRVFVVTPIPSSSDSRELEKHQRYNEAIKKIATACCTPLIDMYTLLGVQPHTNEWSFYYDNTHPNYKGMKRIGKIIANEILRVIE